MLKEGRKKREEKERKRGKRREGSPLMRLWSREGREEEREEAQGRKRRREKIARRQESFIIILSLLAAVRRKRREKRKGPEGGKEGKEERGGSGGREVHLLLRFLLLSYWASAEREKLAVDYLSDREEVKKGGKEGRGRSNAAGSRTHSPLQLQVVGISTKQGREGGRRKEECGEQIILLSNRCRLQRSREGRDLQSNRKPWERGRGREEAIERGEETRRRVRICMQTVHRLTPRMITRTRGKEGRRGERSSEGKGGEGGRALGSGGRA